MSAFRIFDYLKSLLDVALSSPADGDPLAYESSSSLWKNKSLSALLDIMAGSTRGGVIYRGASGWTILVPGTSTYVLTSNGSGADPSYQAAGGGGGSGNVVGPSSATDSSIVLFDSVTGKLIKNSSVAINGDAMVFPNGGVIGFDPSTPTGFSNQGRDVTYIDNGGSPLIRFSGATGEIRFTPPIGWCANVISSGSDVALSRLASGVLILSGGQAGGGGILQIYAVSSGGTPSAGSTRIYSKLVAGSAETFVVDELGNETQISSHAADAPPALYERGPGLDKFDKSVNYFMGVIEWENRTRRRLIDRLDKAARVGTQEQSIAAWQAFSVRIQNNQFDYEADETFSDYQARTGINPWPKPTWETMTPSQRWADDQADKVAASQALIATWTASQQAFTTAHLVWVTAKSDAEAAGTTFSQPEPTFTQIEPVLYVAKPPPDWVTP